VGERVPNVRMVELFAAFRRELAPTQDSCQRPEGRVAVSVLFESRQTAPDSTSAPERRLCSANDFLQGISIALSEFVPSGEAMSMIFKAVGFRQPRNFGASSKYSGQECGDIKGTRMSLQRDLFSAQERFSVELGLSLELLDFVRRDSPFRHCPRDLCSLFRQISVVLDFLRISLPLPRALRLFQR
jgi:hypothetical protein